MSILKKRPINSVPWFSMQVDGRLAEVDRFYSDIMGAHKSARMSACAIGVHGDTECIYVSCPKHGMEVCFYYSILQWNNH